MSPAGEVLGEVSNYGTEEQVLQQMLAVLKANPAYDKPGTDEERVTSPVARAQIRIDLHDYAGAKKELKKAEGDEAHYLRGRIARFEKKWAAMEKQLAQVKGPELADDVTMERAHRLWDDREFKKLAAHLQDFPRSSNRYTEARYYEGLALFHLEKKDDAMATWKATITGCSQDPWIYRADWAYTQTKQGGGRRSFSSTGPKTSLLKRIGYMGRKNPDLAP